MNRRTACELVLLGLTAIVLVRPRAADASTKGPPASSTGSSAAPEHAECHAPAAASRVERYKRTVEAYGVPDVTLLDQDGKKVRLREIVDSGKPVLLNFIFASCTTICPPMAAGFARFQQALGDEAAKVSLISVSIDPDHDAPPVMKQYLGRFNARPGWDFYTGRYDDIVRLKKAFNADSGNKMDHFPLTFLRSPGSREWVRIHGVLGTSELVAEYRKLGR